MLEVIPTRFDPINRNRIVSGTGRAAVFALKKLGLKSTSIFLYNRTVEKGKRVADQMHCLFLEDLSRLDDQIYGFKVKTQRKHANHIIPFQILINTLPGNCDFTIPESSPILKQIQVLFDVNYSCTGIGSLH